METRGGGGPFGVPFWRGRIGPWGRRSCSPVPLYAAPCKAADVSRRYFLVPRRFANVGVAGSSPVSCSRKTEAPSRRCVRRGFAFPGPEPPKCSHGVATRRDNRRIEALDAAPMGQNEGVMGFESYAAEVFWWVAEEVEA